MQSNSHRSRLYIQVRKGYALDGYFWSGTAGQAKRGLEILGVGLIDIDNKDCISLQAVQTPDSQTLVSRDSNLIDWYLLVLNSMKEKLQRVSHYVVAHAYFSKSSFALGLKEMDFDLVSRLRDDTVLFYPALEKPVGKKGRTKGYNGKIDMANLDKSRVQKIDIDNGELYTLITWSKSLKQKVRLVIWYSKDRKKPKLFFSTNPNMSGKDVIEYYRTRFQIEFCIRDAKSFTGLMQSQARVWQSFFSTSMLLLPQLNRQSVDKGKRYSLFNGIL